MSARCAKSFLAVLPFALGPSARAQCLQWDSRFGAPATGGNGMNQGVHAFTVFDDGSGRALYAGGSFTSAGGVSANRIAKWDGASWSPLSTGIDGDVIALAVFDDGSGPALYAGGEFTTAGGTHASNVARWDGVNWSSLGAGTNGVVVALAVFDDGSGPALYAGGFFTWAGGVSVGYVAKWDGTSWSPLGSGVNNLVYALSVFDGGSGPELVVGGYLTMAGGSSARRIARWNGTTWSPLGTGMINAPPIAGVFALTAFDDGSGPALYAGGSFAGAGTAFSIDVAKWDGTDWSGLAGGTNGFVGDLAVFDDGSGPVLFAGGEFTAAGGSSARHVAKWNGTSWSALGVGTNFQVYSLGAFGDGSEPGLFVGGNFSFAGGIPSTYLAKWRDCSESYRSDCPGDGSLRACPCANNGLSGRGCENSASTGGALLMASGSTVPDALSLISRGETSSALSIFDQGVPLPGMPTLLGDGLGCLGGSRRRLYAKQSVAGAATVPQTGDPSISTRSASLGDPIALGSTRSYQVSYRDPFLPFCPAPRGSSFNTSNAVRVVW